MPELHPSDLISLQRQDLKLILGAALPALREQIEDAELKVVLHERFHEQFPAFAGDLTPRTEKLQKAQARLTDLRLAYAAALSAQHVVADLEAQDFGHDVAAYLRKQYGARPFGAGKPVKPHTHRNGDHKS